MSGLPRFRFVPVTGLLVLVLLAVGVILAVAPAVVAPGAACLTRAARHGAVHGQRSAAPLEPTAFAPAAQPSDLSALALGQPAPDVTLHIVEDDDAVMTFPSYVVSYNRSKGGPNWAAWRITAADIGGADRQGRFEPNDALPAGWYRVRHADYTNSGYDRGHMVRSLDRTASDAANATTFLTTNILPQTHALNTGPWKGLEDACTTLARHDGRAVYVVAGAIWGAHPKTIAAGHVAVPEAFWKVAVVLPPSAGAADVTSDTPVMAAVMPNEEGIGHKKWTTYRTNLRSAEQRGGWHVLVAVRAEVRAALEAR